VAGVLCSVSVPVEEDSDGLFRLGALLLLYLNERPTMMSVRGGSLFWSFQFFFFFGVFLIFGDSEAGELWWAMYGGDIFAVGSMECRGLYVSVSSNLGERAAGLCRRFESVFFLFISALHTRRVSPFLSFSYISPS